MAQKRIVHLQKPLIGPEHIKEKVTCIRAHRERIFRLEAELTAQKLICHNYGHGGAGWTFLFGCVHESIRQFERQIAQNPQLVGQPIAIIGAGCYGLLTAILLARKGHAARIAAKQIEDITSYNAAGFFFPRPRKCSKPFECDEFLARGIESYQTYQQIIDGNHPFIKHGPKLLPAYFGPDIDPGFGPYIAQGIVDKPEEVFINFGCDKKYEALEYKTIFINSTVMMHELKQEQQRLGIPLIQETITDFNELPEPIIFNCAGLGAKLLTNDTRIVPIQGHLITLTNQPNVDALQYMINFKVVMTDAHGKKRDELIYFAPKNSGILGVTFIRNQDSLTANQHEFARLLQRCTDFFGQ